MTTPARPRPTPELWAAIAAAQTALRQELLDATDDYTRALRASTRRDTSPSAREHARQRALDAHTRVTTLEERGYVGLLVITKPGLTAAARARAWDAVAPELPPEHRDLARALANDCRHEAATRRAAPPAPAPTPDYTVTGTDGLAL